MRPRLVALLSWTNNPRNVEAFRQFKIDRQKNIQSNEVIFLSDYHRAYMNMYLHSSKP